MLLLRSPDPRAAPGCLIDASALYLPVPTADASGPETWIVTRGYPVYVDSTAVYKIKPSESGRQAGSSCVQEHLECALAYLQPTAAKQ